MRSEMARIDLLATRKIRGQSEKEWTVTKVTEKEKLVRQDESQENVLCKKPRETKIF